ncbi:hypothetical protein MTR67_030892 [Solanum verrucosum]|uniref:Uncharacterized protein n=1 Tax=Solanum verrucosum TaxID=315347 RepID=A0AAF0U1F6_SOLVR|nr:hypothetical protein MTR67_030892 [Solanum verrucosum]
MARVGGPWFTTATPPQQSSEKSAKSRLTDRSTVRRSDNGPWSMSMDQDLLYPASDTNYGRLAWTANRSTGLDFMGPFVSLNRMNYIFLVVDYVSKLVEDVAL